MCKPSWGRARAEAHRLSDLAQGNEISRAGSGAAAEMPEDDQRGDARNHPSKAGCTA
ncbi:hypothetical protein JOF56_003764 [Kibdelosporangium banguiense]|uniref:Uncharacterized protein n=1 Tax=Kibdelosporangium banguiense TaxID=1365924 RepID=A0ABS4THA7_9PSEU|nr:hypothetical protein [Kibdelosporangium banguiense]